MSFRISSPAQVRTRAIEEVLRAYLAWREECWWVGDAYGRWSKARRSDDTLAYSVYVDALEREEAAAITYAQQLERAGHLIATMPCEPVARQ